MTTEDTDHKAPPDAADEHRVLAMEKARALADEAEAKAREVAVLMAELARLLEHGDAEP